MYKAICNGGLLKTILIYFCANKKGNVHVKKQTFLYTFFVFLLSFEIPALSLNQLQWINPMQRSALTYKQKTYVSELERRINFQETQHDQ